MRDIEEQCTTLEQSKRLVELGFTKDSASLMWEEISIIGSGREEYWVISFIEGNEEIYKPIPCWTCTDMMNIIKDNTFYISCMNPAVILMKTSYTNGFAHSEILNVFESVSFRDNLFNCIVWLKENKYL